MKYSIPLATLTLCCFAIGTIQADSPSRFERTYTPQHAAHLTLSNVNGSIHVAAWDKKTVFVHAGKAPSVSIEDRVVGDDITISAKRNMSLGRADFDVSMPPETSISIKNIIGNIELRGITGHVSVTSIDSDVHLIKMSSPVVDVIVTSGDIFFDGELQEGGSYNLQSMRGDLDVTVPSQTPFNLNARALSENINLGPFFSSLTGSSRGPKGVSGTHLKGGPRLALTAYTGRILLHRK
jgi:DUF4097 and DUF4098 domain-containing protein YvlB